MAIHNDGLTEHPLSGFGPGLVSRDQTVRESLNDFYGAVHKAITDYNEALAQAEKVDPDLKDTARAERQHKIIAQAQRKLERTLAAEIQSIGSGVEGLKEEITLAAQPKVPETEIGQLLGYLRMRDIQHDFQRLNGETRARLLRESVNRGDRSILTAMERSLTPMVAPVLLDAAREDFARAVAAPAVQRLEIASHVLDSAKVTARLAQGKAETLLGKAKGILPRPASMTFQSPAKDMTDAEKAAFIGKHGLGQWKQFLAGTWTPPKPDTE